MSPPSPSLNSVSKRHGSAQPDCSATCLKEKPFLRASFFVLAARFLHRVPFRNFRDRHVPPGFVARHPLLVRCLCHNPPTPILFFPSEQCGLQFRARCSPRGPRAQAPLVPRKIRRYDFPVILLPLAIPA